jgi:DNA invertase Pin-like site-specific DNA recombinase
MSGSVRGAGSNPSPYRHGRKVGTKVRLTVEKEKLIRQLHAEGKPVAAIARLVSLTRKTVYRAIRQQEVAG